MKKMIISLAAGMICSLSIAQYNSRNLFLAPHETAARFTYENMRVYPLYANEGFKEAQKNVGNYSTLKEALDKNHVKITEKSSGGRGGAEVNKLYIQNLSSDTVIILGGEVVHGGQQDRMIANDVIVPPKSGKIDLSVFCVEHGRWSYNSGAGASDNNFRISNGAACSFVNIETVKAAKVKKNQSEVWKEVEEITDKTDSKSSTGTYSAIKDNKDMAAKISEYQKYFTTLIAGDSRIIGMTVVTGDSILGCDMFATHSLLMDHCKNLITSYATESLTSGKPVTVPYTKVKSYMDGILADETKQEELIKTKGSVLKNNNNKIHIAVY